MNAWSVADRIAAAYDEKQGGFTDAETLRSIAAEVIQEAINEDERKAEAERGIGG